jgi:hypothetical protein
MAAGYLADAFNPLSAPNPALADAVGPYESRPRPRRVVSPVTSSSVDCGLSGADSRRRRESPIVHRAAICSVASDSIG